MKITRIGMTNFMRYAERVVELPTFGLVVVTGPNGSGKSSLPEAVANAYWGKSLRDETPWRHGEAGVVEVCADGLVATRSATKKGTKKLSWVDLGSADERKFDTTRDAQAELERNVGSFAQWRRTHVLSSSDSAHFTDATDAQRKELVEELFDIQDFDSAEALASESAKEASALVRASQASLAHAQRRYDAAKQAATRPDFAEPAPESVVLQPPPEPVEKPVPVGHRVELEAALVSLQAEAARPAPEPTADPGLRAAYTEEMAIRKLAWTRLSTARAGLCSTCGTIFDEPDQIHALEEEHEAARDAEAAALAAVEADSTAVAAARAEARRHVVTLREEVERLRCRIAEDDIRAQSLARYTAELARTASQQADQDARDARAFAAWEARREASQAAQQAANAEWAAAEEALSTVEDEGLDAAASLAMASACKSVLGLRGARGRVLGEALRAVEAVANGFIAGFFGPHARLSLASTTEQANGKQVGKIGLEVYGVGGEVGYKGLSGGERRRVDAAILLAFAEVSTKVCGRPAGTLFTDEVFDAVDDEGVAALAATLAELAKTRCIVVITHNKVLAQQLPAVRRIDCGDPPPGALARRAADLRGSA